jgi:hypothetical protein
MKHASSARKTAQHAAPLAQPAGSDAVAVAPPSYGIDLVDQAAATGVEQQAPGLRGALQMQPAPSCAVNSAGAQAESRTGLPDTLKAGVESISGLSLNDVRVHYNSPRPAQLQALAYTQGTDIHVAPGQQRHLPHEAWHVVQQKQGRVRPTVQTRRAAINTDQGLEREADVMGARALQIGSLRNPVAQRSKVGKKASDFPAAQLFHSRRDIVQMRTWTEWLSEVGSMTVSSLWGWLTDIPMRLRNIFIDLPLSLINDLRPLVEYIGQAVSGQEITANLGNAALTLFGSLARFALRLIFDVVDLLPLTPLFEIINVAVNEHLRPMDPGELAAANWTYGARPRLWNRVRVSHDDQGLLRVFSYVAGGGNYNAFIGMATYHMIRMQDQGNANANLQNTVHELGHIVQFDRRGATYTMAEAAAHGVRRGYRYLYLSLQNQPLTWFGREQQCRIAEHGWAVHNGGHPNDFLGSLPTGASHAPLLAVQGAYQVRLAEWRASQF